jgi:hypothetical protein
MIEGTRGATSPVMRERARLPTLGPLPRRPPIESGRAAPDTDRRELADTADAIVGQKPGTGLPQLSAASTLAQPSESAAQRRTQIHS